jgi:hypothetical protein
MKSFVLALFLLIAAVPAIGAVNTALPTPIVVVYPFSATGGVSDPEAGGRLAVLFASRLSQGGALDVRPGTPGTDRAHYLEDARKLGADYYVTGYLTPLGDEVSLVDQIVSTHSGIVVWSTTTQVRTYDEALGQSDLMRDAITHYEVRSLAELGTPAPLRPASPSPPAGGENLSKIFARHGKATPAPRSTPTRAPAPPTPPAPGSSTVALAPGAKPAGAIVVAVGGDASAQDRSYASNALSSALAKAGLGGLLVTTTTTSDLTAQAHQLCSSNRAGSIFSGNLSLQQQTGALVRKSSANFELVRYDCAGAVTDRQRAQTSATGHSGNTTAIDRAVAQTLAAALAPPKTKKT